MLVTNWRRVLVHAWSVRLNVATAIVGYAASMLPYLQTYVSPPAFLAITATLAVASAIVRIIPQRKVSHGRRH
jgi:hypothetical protein